jgi:ferric-dicitrate binding protein FerR (iron transport regulator)
MSRALPLFAVLIAGLSVAPRIGAADTTCQIARIDGGEVRIAARDGWRVAGTGEAVDAASRVATGPGTRVEITCADGTIVTIGPGTDLALGDLTGQGDGLVMDLWNGIVGIVAPTPSRTFFEVRTGLAIASVRSTEWLVEITAASATAVFAREGAVAVTSPGNPPVTLTEGEGVTVGPDGVADDVRVWSEARRAQSFDALGFGWQ